MNHVLHERRWLLVAVCAFCFGFQFSGICQAELSAAAPATRTSFDDVPLAPMGDEAYQILRSALDAASKNISTADADANRAALEKLRKFIFPDFTKLQCVEFTVPAWNKSQFAFILQSNNSEGNAFILNPDFTVFWERMQTISIIKSLDHAAEADEINRFESQPATSHWRLTPGDNFGPGDAKTQLAVYYFHEAMIAAELGDEATAELLLRDALKQESTAVDSAYSHVAGWSYRFGISLLEDGCRPALIVNLWQQSLAADPEVNMAIRLKDYVADFQDQISQAQKTAADETSNPQALPLDQRLAYYLNRFPDVHGEQLSQPGICITTGMGRGTEISDAIVAIGRDALPILIEHLTDRRFTRSIGLSRDFGLRRTVLRVQDVAVECIDHISGINFYRQSSSSSYLSTENPDLRDKVIADIKSWWAVNANKTQVESLIARLDTGNIYNRIDILRKIEKLDPKAVDSIAYLKKWVDGSKEGDLIQIAQELANRKDLSLLPEMRDLLRREGSEPIEDAVWYSVMYGNIEDFQYLQNQMKQDIEKGADMSTNSWYGAMARYLTKITVFPDSMFETLGGEASKFKHGENILWVPFLLDYLSQRKSIGGRREPDWIQEETFSLADAAIGPLIALTGHNEGYAGSDDEHQRYPAIDRWQAWWKATGEDQFLKDHPEVTSLIRP
jgi:hypothetical protein